VNACIKGYFDIVLLLLNFGVNPNKIDIITGTGPLHEAVRYSHTHDGMNNDVRLKTVQYLAQYGADPEQPNAANETPMKIVISKNEKSTELFIQKLKRISSLFLRLCFTILLYDSFFFCLLVFYKTPHRTPKFINIDAQSLNELTQTPIYPLLRPRLNWTRNDFRFCTQYKNNNQSSSIVTNLIDGSIYLDCFFVVAKL
jgi:hypothetical protein